MSSFANFAFTGRIRRGSGIKIEQIRSLARISLPCGAPRVIFMWLVETVSFPSRNTLPRDPAAGQIDGHFGGKESRENFDVLGNSSGFQRLFVISVRQFGF